MGLTVKYCFNHPEGINIGDMFLNNSPYHGNTHHADFTYIAPVFSHGELLFFAVAKGHQADIGNSIPSTYHANARDLYEEGAISWPCVKVEKDYKEVPDIIAIAKARIRVPEIWYGDHQACVGSARTGEKRLEALCAEYGNNLMKDFCDAYHAYGSRRMQEEIASLPAGTWHYDIKSDAIKGLTPEINIHISCEIKPEEGRMIIDLTDNIDSLPCGLNMCEATVRGSAVTGVLNRLPNDIPSNEGSMSHIEVLMREGCMIGKSVAPYSSSLATTNLADRLISGVQALLNQVTEERGVAEGGAVQCPAVSVISGKDWRRNNHPFVNQMFCGMTGGPGVNGYDGWVTYQYPCTGGALNWNSVETLEQQYPILIIEEEIIPDSVGPGRFDSAPACKFVLAPRGHPVTCAYSCDGIDNPPFGAVGGGRGRASAAWKYTIAEGEASAQILPPFAEPTIQLGDAIVSESSSGGGYGDPLEREPSLVSHRVREGWISEEFARKTYGVVIDTSGEDYLVDEEATARLRKELASQRGDAL